MPHRDEYGGQRAELQTEVDERRAQRGQRQHSTREVDLADEDGIRSDRFGGGRHRRVHERPDDEATHQPHGEGPEPLPKDREGNAVDGEQKQRLDHRPDEPDARVLVAHFQFFVHERREQLAKADDVEHVLPDRPLGGDDAQFRGGASGGAHDPPMLPGTSVQTGARR